MNEQEVSYSAQNDNPLDNDNEQSSNGKHSSTESISEVSINNSVNTRKTTPRKPSLKSRQKKSVDDRNLLTLNELAERLNFKPRTLSNYLLEETLEGFAKRTQNKDPEGIAWQRSPQKGARRAVLFMPTVNQSIS